MERLFILSLLCSIVFLTATARVSGQEESELLPRYVLDELALTELAADLKLRRDQVLLRSPDRDMNPGTGEEIFRYRAVPRGELGPWAEGVYDLRGARTTERAVEAEYGIDFFAVVDGIKPCRTGSLFSGVKYHDLDRDGIRDANEPLLSGWQIVVSNGFQSYMGTTGPDGSYLICAPLSDLYIVSEVSQPDWTQTAPQLGEYVIYASGQSVHYTNLDFGNYTEENPCVDFSLSVSCGGISQVTGEFQCNGAPYGGQAPYQYTWNLSPSNTYWFPQGPITTNGAAHLFAECYPDGTPPYVNHTAGLTVTDANGCVAHSYGNYLCSYSGGGGGGGS